MMHNQPAGRVQGDLESLGLAMSNFCYVIITAEKLAIEVVQRASQYLLRPDLEVSTAE